MHDLICIQTRKKLITHPERKDLLTVSDGPLTISGGPSYPLLDGIPVLLPNPSLFLAESYFQYSKYILQNQAYAERFSQPYQGLTLRSNAVANLAKGVAVNLDLIRQSIAPAEEYFSKKDLMFVAVNHHFPEMQQIKALAYLKRDWSGLPEGEAQIAIIRKSLAGILEQAETSDSQALVLGAGLGRIAWEVSPWFRHVYATDLALPMASFYSRIARGEQLNFSDLYYSQIAYNSHSTRNLFASAAAAGYKEKDISLIRDKVSYFMADACQLPLADESVSCILSVYFTDVLPFPAWFSEVNRVLKKGGLFIHFGPLGNNFKLVQSMFSAEDIKAWLFKYGYKGIHESTAPATHLSSDQKMHTDLYDNWVYAARKEAESFSVVAAEVNARSVPRLYSDFNFTARGSGSPAPAAGSASSPAPAAGATSPPPATGAAIQHILYNSYKDKEYPDAELVIQFLLLVDGTTPIQAIADTFNRQRPDSITSVESFIAITRFLVTEGLLTIRKNNI